MLTYGLVARPAEKSSDQALALARQDHREEQSFHGALSAREDAQYDVALLQRQSGYASARAVLLKADALLINGDGGFDAYPPRYGPALVAYTRVRTLVASFENQLPSRPACNGCKQVLSRPTARESPRREPGQVVDTRRSPSEIGTVANAPQSHSTRTEATETTAVAREPLSAPRRPAMRPTNEAPRLTGARGG